MQHTLLTKLKNPI